MAGETTSHRKASLELPGARISWFVYVVRLAKGITDSQRNTALEELALRGIETGRYFEPIHLQPAYRDVSLPRAPLPVTESVAQRTFALPFFTRITNDQQEAVCEALSELCEVI